MLLDAHAHLEMYEDSVDDVLSELDALSVLTISNSMDPESYEKNLALARRSAFVVPTFGIHPWVAPEWSERLDELGDAIERSPMLGELGLDRRFIEDASLYPAQEVVFEFLLDAAAGSGKAVTVHTAGAETEVLERLDRHGVDRVIVHWYSGPLDVLHAFAERGTMMTVGVGVLHHDHFREIAREIPGHLLLTETDNPGGVKWLTGEPGRPRVLLDVIEEIARLRGTTRDDIIETVNRNFARFISDDPRMSEVHAEHFARCDAALDARRNGESDADNRRPRPEEGGDRNDRRS